VAAAGVDGREHLGDERRLGWAWWDWCAAGVAQGVRAGRSSASARQRVPSSISMFPRRHRPRNPEQALERRADLIFGSGRATSPCLWSSRSMRSPSRRSARTSAQIATQLP